MAELGVSVCNPLLRTPLSLIVDDSCPVVNLTYHWIRQRHAWKARHQPGVAPDRWEGDPRKVASVVPTIPAEFARRWAEWCGAEGIRGKFSLVPFPAGVGRIDEGFPDGPPGELEAWLDVVRNVLHPNFDLTPEMLTHTHVVDLDTMELTDEWEQGEWVDPPAEKLPGYLTPFASCLQHGCYGPHELLDEPPLRRCESLIVVGVGGQRSEERPSFVHHQTSAQILQSRPKVAVKHPDVRRRMVR